MSPEKRIPPSAIIGIFKSLTDSTDSTIAESCGTPTPDTILVVQILPGPIPTFIASAPASASALAPSLVAIFPAIISSSLEIDFFNFLKPLLLF